MWNFKSNYHVPHNCAKHITCKPHWTLTTTLCGRYYYHSGSADEEAEAQTWYLSDGTRSVWCAPWLPAHCSCWLHQLHNHTILSMLCALQSDKVLPHKCMGSMCLQFPKGISQILGCCRPRMPGSRAPSLLARPLEGRWKTSKCRSKNQMSHKRISGLIQFCHEPAWPQSTHFPLLSSEKLGAWT